MATRGAINPAASGTSDVQRAAQSIFDALPEDPFGNEPVVEADGTEIEPTKEERDPPAEPEDAEEATEEPEGETEDESEDTEEPEDAEAEGEDEADEEDDSGEPDTRFTVRVDGEEVEVTLDELLAGYSRTASWTRKSQALASERKTFEAERAETTAQRAEYAQKLSALEQQLAASLPKEPGPNDGPDVWGRYLARKSELERVQVEQHRVFEEHQAAVTRTLEDLVERETEALRERVPEWKEDAKMAAGLKSVFTYAVGTLGFDEEEVRNVRDHRIIMMLKENMEAREILASRSTVAEKTKKAKTLKPGSRPSQKSVARAKQKAARKQGRDALRKSGRIDDAVEAFDKAGILDGLI